MPPAPPAKSDRTPPPDREFRGPPEEEFWERYNGRLEFPLSTVAAVLLHVAVGALLVFVLVRLMDHGDDRSAVPVKLIDAIGMDDAGDGSAGSGGSDAVKEGENQFKAQQDILPTPQALEKAREDIKRMVLEDPTGSLPIAASNAAAFEVIDKELAKKMLGSRRGQGPGDGTGTDGSTGKGPGGSGADSTRARSLRWVLRFRTADGSDYVAQLAAMGATVLVPLPPENRECLYFSDLRNTGNKRTATEDDLKQLSGQIKFSDTRPGSVAGVCAALGVQQPARSFWAFFPRGLEDELSRKELNYRNRRSEDIEETIFQVVVRGGGYEVVVVGQTVKQ
jgi:hypothetical protein